MKQYCPYIVKATFEEIINLLNEAKDESEVIRISALLFQKLTNELHLWTTLDVEKTIWDIDYYFEDTIHQVDKIVLTIHIEEDMVHIRLKDIFECLIEYDEYKNPFILGEIIFEKSFFTKFLD